MVFDKKMLREYLVSFLLILASGLVLHRSTNPLNLPKASLIFLLFLTVAFRWILRARRSFTQRTMRRNAALFGCACIWLCLMQTVKYAFSVTGSPAQRYLWYLYYAAFLFAPLWFFLGVLHLGKPDDYRGSRFWHLTYLPALALLLAVLTNDGHQLVFRFQTDAAHWLDGYSYGVGYYLIIAWIAVMMTAAVAVLLKSCLLRRILRNLWLPALVLLFVASYWIHFTTDEGVQNTWLQQFYEMPVFVGYCALALLETLRIARIIPSNTGYEEFFAASSLRAGLADEAFNVCRVSAGGSHPAPETLREAADKGTLLLPVHETVLKTSAVCGGWFYWTEDVGALHRLNEQLAEAAEGLKEENTILQQEAETEESRQRTAHQTALYDAVAHRIRPQLTAADRLLDTAAQTEDEDAFRDCMIRTAGVFTFLKRCSNLLLLANEQPVLQSAELQRCMEQSAIWLRERGVACETEAQPLTLPADTAVRIYELFEAAAEQTALTALSLHLEQRDGGLLLTLRIAPGGECPSSVLQRAEALGKPAQAHGETSLTLTVPIEERMCAP